ncbi:hypothetical protein A2617_00475 [Candidatus Daviesbacteria bacterium RIFOXYD1_FULL_41_10]|uniref:Triosephosphate isomerase n=2 Tax=Candidatus Daviesiibacteriota TaxID=1752718 RepID=A0A1F5N022_9BACT|nr:MAG: Triosephosphate isomerase [Candidatus Daviesbacteria bacterium GW2011_GWB1_41_5]OGE71009.1 MAG: hypothetical protein A2617_00475 [Candidatus Daviesbacteria bacterium RIFOXYD1_FULL_41_10]
MAGPNIWIVANWKSNKTIAEALQWVDAVGPNLLRRENLKIVVCPAYTDIEEVKKAVMVGNYPLMVGSQDLSEFDNGPYTGEESARILKDLVDLSILGHCERRQNFNETDEIVAEKVKRAREANIIPLVCVQSESTPVPENVDLVAYEPVEAVGTGSPDTPQDASQIAQKLKEKYPMLQVLYGGSITPENAKAFLQQQNLDGLLVGMASLNPNEFLKIVKIAEENLG